MISSALSQDEEIQVSNAYAKIGLIADKIWARNHQKDDSWIKLNRLLWIQKCKLSQVEQEPNNDEISRKVRDVIPMSRLAIYGDYEYDEEREKMYKANETTTWPHPREQSHSDDPTAAVCDEPWMLTQVEEYFIKLSSPVQILFEFSYQEKIGTETRAKRLDDFGKYCPPLLWSVLDKAELQLQARVCSKLVKDLWKLRSGHSSYWEKGLCDDAERWQKSHSDEKRRRDDDPETLILRKEPSFGETSRRHIFPVLSAQVPEFFPKGPPNMSDNDNKDVHQRPMKFFPSASERTYQDELFPYNRAHSIMSQNAGCVPIAVSHPTTVNSLIRAPHQWIHRMIPPIQIQVPGVCSAALHHHQQPPIYSRIPQAICPATIFHRPIIHDIHDKIIPGGQQTHPVPIPVYQRPVELYHDYSAHRRGKNHHGVDFNNLILLTKNAMKARRNQSKNPQKASSFILESRQPNLKSERDVLQWLDKGYPKRAREFATVNCLVSGLTSFVEKSDCTICENPEETFADDSEVLVAKKRLYRDVLTNSSSSNEFILETVLDKRYDELEQQAMEQYRTSEECLALRYQELERQALEQYKNGESWISKTSIMSGKKDDRQDDARDSGFGSSSSKNIASERGTVSERQMTILRSENKCPSSVPSSAFRGAVCQNINTRGFNTTPTTKSLTALNNETFEGKNWKNIIKGASGDKMEETGRSSLMKNKHVILVSPLKQSIPIRDIITTNNKRISRYYRKPSTIDGGGDDDNKVTILRSPSQAQVWLSSLWG